MRGAADDVKDRLVRYDGRVNHSQSVRVESAGSDLDYAYDQLILVAQSWTGATLKSLGGQVMAVQTQ